MSDKCTQRLTVAMLRAKVETPFIFKESTMPWYAWLIIVLVLGSILASLLLLRDTAKKLPLSDEQLQRIKQRNAEQDAKDAREP